MKNKKIYVIVLILVILGIGLLLLSTDSKENAKEIDYDKEYEKQDLDKYQYFFVTKYDDYKKILDEQKDETILIGEELSEEKFNGSRYLLLIVETMPCHESLKYSNTKYEDNSYKIYFNVNYECGVCATDKQLYQIKVGASDTKKILVFYKTLSRAKCDKDIEY